MVAGSGRSPIFSTSPILLNAVVRYHFRGWISFGSSIRGGSPAENLCLLSGSTHTLVASNCAEGPASARRGRRNGGEPRNSASGPRVISLDQADGSSRALLQVALVSVHREAVAPSLRAQAGALVWAPVGARCWAQSRRRFDPQPAQDVRYCHGGRG